jgi:hypothetical protein
MTPSALPSRLGPARLPAVLVVFFLVLSGLFVAWSAMPTAQGANGVAKDMTFFLHWVNDTEPAKTIHGYSVRNYLDTTLDFNDVNVSVTSATKFTAEWWLTPALAGDFRASALTLYMWMNASGGQKSSQITVGIYDVVDASVDPNGVLVAENNFGNRQLQTMSTLEVFNFTFDAEYAFNASNSLRVEMSLTPGTDTSVTLFWDTPTVNSRVTLFGPDSVDVAAIGTFDADGLPTTTFDPMANNTTMFVRATVTDPLGGYDLRWVNLTLTSPTGLVLLDNVSMSRVSGTPVSFASTYEIAWNYTGQPTGEYTVLVWALDNNGHNRYFFFQQFDFGDHPDAATATFFIGGPPVYVNVLAVDSKNAPLAGATIVLVSGGFAVDAETTDGNGLANLTMASGTYEFRVVWQAVQVASLTESVEDNVSASSPLVIATQVYYPTFQAEDDEGVALAGASLLFVHPNGETFGPFKTDGKGQVTLDQAPAGIYGVAASWRGVNVFTGSRDVSGDGVIAFRTAVYQLAVTAKAGDGEVLAGVFVSVEDATGLVFDAGMTDGNGTVVLRLPAGSYTVRARYVTEYLGSLYDSGTRSASLDLSASTEIVVTFSDFPLAVTTTFVFLFGLLYALTLVGLLALFYLLWRGKKGVPGEEEEPADEA